MFGAGVTSSVWGFTIGREALKGTTQPDVRPSNNAGSGKQGSATSKDQVSILKEKDILKTVKARVEGRDPDKKTAGTNTKADKASPKPATAKKPAAANASAKFPLNSRDGGVTLEVSAASQRSNSMLLDVSMKNEGSQAVRFLYSFLNVTDNQGRALSATAEDLPAELPPNGQVYYGTVSIPTALLENAKEISLTLTDYPGQKLQLQISGIPVAK
ncbi:MAG: hypothetical protein JGK17_17825 [Microcoleus sp. PH2017_10_PVI_O_A]|uniref:hypothetical protein n=1 Tax=unclassified Microcoleus TaxID=2642155 RepID=UPI001DF45958|nr:MULTISPECIES: hypothetical protein [unclassified Microcoleus]TAE80876.1 MAG: hypothetical protein EAZ83_16885 [Oscillatoriales cyanobacterium]MCC3407411.1 hypothetical protein [Microcoleus sp. PH2017_10_PVI_O_A]MCC3461470.1 hypothetical protein [Microcoleus sp. PH2017_11_PCY_U_A]MCC3479944.1 hypothetical protein [Microcoleus sp. PH2017_12_PCY_D_A]MCC3528600.1 hypothetical protein [Microcoleus sp. PH2017_21_RUC_O_A]